MQIIFEADLNKMTEELQELSPERLRRTAAGISACFSGIFSHFFAIRLDFFQSGCMFITE